MRSSGQRVCPTTGGSRRFSSTESVAYIPRSSGTYARPARARSCGVRSERSIPPSVTVPRRCRCRPMIARRTVVFPAPLRPTSVTSSPPPTRNEMPRSACASPYHAVRSATCSIGLCMRLTQIRGDDRGIFTDGVVATLCDHASLEEHDHLLRQLGHYAHVVLDEHDGPIRAHAPDELDGALDVVGIHAGGRLVEQQKPRIERDRERELERALLSVRKAPCGAVRERAEADVREQRTRAVVEPGERAGRAPEAIAQRRVR